ncbi:MAG: hypothetical protein LBQ86_02780 [Holophagales bacterium]|jgi:hypothetical protein|nr:hypothetical protein [Holophagales bacterium]
MSMDFKKMACAGIMLALALTGCREGGDGAEVVIAKIGAEKITEAEFNELVNALVGDTEKAEEFLTDERNRGQRNEFLAKYVESKGIMMLAKEEGLDKDIRVRLQLDEAITNVYVQAFLERRLTDAEPTDAQIREVYDEVAAQQKANGVTIPSFEESRPYLPQAWKQKQQQVVAESLMKELRTKFPATFADEYKAVNNQSAISK